jgi:hypothetical protein
MKEQGADNKAVRFHAYKMYTRMRHGVLHHFDRQPLPVCVCGEILDELCWLPNGHKECRR